MNLLKQGVVTFTIVFCLAVITGGIAVTARAVEARDGAAEVHMEPPATETPARAPHETQSDGTAPLVEYKKRPDEVKSFIFGGPPPGTTETPAPEAEGTAGTAPKADTAVTAPVPVIPATPHATEPPMVTPAPTETAEPLPASAVTPVPAIVPAPWNRNRTIIVDLPRIRTMGYLPIPIEPGSVTMLGGLTTGRNELNPTWSPQGDHLAFEQSWGDNKEIVIIQKDNAVVRRVSLKPEVKDDDMALLFEEILDQASYNAGITWSPAGDRFVFMSNAGGGNYDLYLGNMGDNETRRLTRHTAKDGLAHWSPADNRVAFISGRTGKGDVYLVNIDTRVLTQLTRGEKAFLYPRWSPDGSQLAVIYGSNENHDIHLITDLSRPLETNIPLTTWRYDDLRPIWSPDGRKIAFYSNYNEEEDPKEWAIVVIAADGSDPRQGDGLAVKVVARNVIPDVECGPAWMPDSNRIVYVKNEKASFHPIYIVDISNKTDLPLLTNTRMNHDVSCSITGTLSFRSQVEQWDHIHMATLKD